MQLLVVFSQDQSCQHQAIALLSTLARVDDMRDQMLPQRSGDLEIKFTWKDCGRLQQRKGVLPLLAIVPALYLVALVLSACRACQGPSVLSRCEREVSYSRESRHCSHGLAQRAVKEPAGAADTPQPELARQPGLPFLP